jgi:polysaccharide chain length determinant protein (PEP-CTERM system associated)
MAKGSEKPQGRQQSSSDLSPEHFFRLLVHRKWLVLIVWLVVSAATGVFVQRLPNLYTSETVILVNPQKVPEAYVKATVTGDIRGRLNTLSQQILSATRLQKIIDSFNLYQEEKKTMVKEEILAKMRKEIVVKVMSDFGAGQDLTAFKITYSGRQPRLVAQVANELANLFIDENLKARELQATGTSDFIQNQLQTAKKTLDDQEEKLKQFRIGHIGEMPEQQGANLQILGNLQQQIRAAADSLSRAEQQKAMLLSMVNRGNGPDRVVDLDESNPQVDAPAKVDGRPAGPSAAEPVSPTRAKLETALGRGYSEQHPEVKKLRAELAAENAQRPIPVPVIQAAPVAATSAAPTLAVTRPTTSTQAQRAGNEHYNPIVQSQLRTLDQEIEKYKQDQARLNKQAATYQARLEAIPMREQEIAQLVRDHDISKAHYTNLLDKQFSAETATQLEIRQKGEKFEVLDPALPASKPSSPNRILLNIGGLVVGFLIGFGLAVATEFLGMTITAAGDIMAITGTEALEVIPVIQTQLDITAHKKRMWMASAAAVICMLLACAGLLYHYRSQVF